MLRWSCTKILVPYRKYVKRSTNPSGLTVDLVIELCQVQAAETMTLAFRGICGNEFTKTSASIVIVCAGSMNSWSILPARAQETGLRQG
jgi:hypothetical protein